MGDAAPPFDSYADPPPNMDDAAAAEEPVVNLDIKNPHSQLVTDIFENACWVFQTYGWYFTFAVILYIVIWTNIRDSVYRLLNRLQKQFSGQEFKDPQKVQNRLEAMERSRLRLQEKYELEASVKLERIREREAQKMADAVKDHDALKSGKSQSSTLRRIDQEATSNTNASAVTSGAKQKKPLRASDYNPLTGTSNSGARYRPTSRRPTSGG